MKLEEIPDYGDLMTLTEFLECVEIGMFTPDDGSGYFATQDKMSDVSVWSLYLFLNPRQKFFTHVVWFNQ